MWHLKMLSESCSVVSHILRHYELYSPWNSPGQNTWVGSLSLLQGIFPSPGIQPRPLALQADFFFFFSSWATREALVNIVKPWVFTGTTGFVIIVLWNVNKLIITACFSVLWMFRLSEASGEWDSNAPELLLFLGHRQ